MYMLTAKQIKAIRKKLALSTTELAYKLGVTTNAVARWEIGDRRPRWETMCRLNQMATEAGMTPAELAAADEPAVPAAV